MDWDNELNQIHNDFMKLGCKGILKDIDKLSKKLDYDFTDHERRLLSCLYVQLEMRLNPVVRAEYICRERYINKTFIKTDDYK